MDSSFFSKTYTDGFVRRRIRSKEERDHGFRSTFERRGGTAGSASGAGRRAPFSWQLDAISPRLYSARRDTCNRLRSRPPPTVPCGGVGGRSLGDRGFRTVPPGGAILSGS